METPRETAGKAGSAADGTMRGCTPGSRQTQFKPGHPGPKKRKKKYDGQTLLLNAMRRVYNQDKAKDRSEKERNLRAMLEGDPKGFLSQLAALEKFARSATSSEGDSSEGGRGEDVGEERVLDLIDKLLEEWKGGVK